MSFYLKLYGGKVVSEIDDSSITHFIVESRNQKWIQKAFERRIHVVPYKWIKRSIEANQLLDDNIAM